MREGGYCYLRTALSVFFIVSVVFSAAAPGAALAREDCSGGCSSPVAMRSSPVAIPAQEKQDHHEHPSPGRVHRFERQVVTVEDFSATGLILAIGGGGEGIIGRLKGEQVVAIDISRPELEGAPPGPLKIVMDARDMKFLDGSFGAASSFFTLCYIDGEDHPKVFEETFRVLRSGGKFLVWDVIFGERIDENKDSAVIPLIVRLPDRGIGTGYGVHWPEKPHDLDYYMKLAGQAGFEVVGSDKEGQWFFLVLEKP